MSAEIDPFEDRGACDYSSSRMKGTNSQGRHVHSVWKMLTFTVIGQVSAATFVAVVV